MSFLLKKVQSCGGKHSAVWRAQASGRQSPSSYPPSDSALEQGLPTFVLVRAQGHSGRTCFLQLVQALAVSSEPLSTQAPRSASVCTPHLQSGAALCSRRDRAAGTLPALGIPGTVVRDMRVGRGTPTSCPFSAFLGLLVGSVFSEPQQHSVSLDTGLGECGQLATAGSYGHGKDGDEHQGPETRVEGGADCEHRVREP